VLIVIAYGMMTQEEAKSFKPTLVFPDQHNKPVL
jgi:aspartate 1-decarboxylase